jgi:TetR/AcrR family transcriptional regulator, cholesterol catabolism regulator
MSTAPRALRRSTTARKPGAAARRRTRRADPVERWQQIIAAATAEFLAKGYVGASMRDVSARVGLLKGSLYHYIDSKEDLLFHVLRDLHEGAAGVVERCRTGPGQPLDRLRELIEYLGPYSAEHAAQGMIFMRDFAFLPAPRRRQIIRQRDLYSSVMRELISAAQARGDVPRSIDPALAAATIMGSIAWVANWYRPGGRLSAADIGRQQAALLIAALRHGTPPPLHDAGVPVR